jgi:hypothetical protein
MTVAFPLERLVVDPDYSAWLIHNEPNESRTEVYKIILGVVDAAGLSLGIPPAKRLPSWGGPPLDGRLIDGAVPSEGAPIAPPPLRPTLPPFAASIIGSLRSLVSAFFNFLPAWICFKSSLEAMVVKGEKQLMFWTVFKTSANRSKPS